MCGSRGPHSPWRNEHSNIWRRLETRRSSVSAESDELREQPAQRDRGRRHALNGDVCAREGGAVSVLEGGFHLFEQARCLAVSTTCLDGEHLQALSADPDL